MERIPIITSKEKEVIDITEDVQRVITKSQKNSGLCHMFLPHSTAGLTTAYISPESELELIDFLPIALPHFVEFGKRYEHSHVAARIPNHVVASFLGSSVAIPFHEGKLLLGEYQRIILVELNGPRKRTVIVSVE